MIDLTAAQEYSIGQYLDLYDEKLIDAEQARRGLLANGVLEDELPEHLKAGDDAEA